MTDNLVEFEDVTKVYPRKGEDSVHALDGISLRVPAGDIHGIVGQSGAGKSTLIRCLTALEKPTSGRILVAGQNLAELGERQLRQARRSIGMVFQSANLLDSRTAAANIAYPLYLAGKKRGERHSRVEELLALVGLAGRGSSYPSQLSGGQRQRVGIARALADEPKLLLCDEPTSALDSESTEQILNLIRDVRDRLGVTVLIITHEMAVVRDVCDSVTMLEGGRVIQSGAVSEILTDPDTRLATELMPPPKVAADITLDGAYTKIIDIAFTSEPGLPTGSKVLAKAAEIGADLVGGTFETVGTTQVGRLALAVEVAKVESALRDFKNFGIEGTVRA
ncbi:MAG: methionine ABC transporter ATP-binding protein [Varibaculum sp.]|nr:methionine ABC transporter ATP-binding protein [Varibaculum sp.]